MNKSALRTIEVLELIAENKKGIKLSEISRGLKMPMSSTSDILRSLLNRKMVEVDDTLSYKIGVKNLLLGNAYLANIDVVAISMPFIAQLSEQTNATVFLGKLIDDRIIYLHKHEPKEFLVSTCRIGSRARLSTTALGKIILAYNTELQEKVLSDPLPQKTAYSITDPDEFRKELIETKERGYSIDKRENDEKILSVGFPLFDESVNVDHCISISGIYQEGRDVAGEVELGLACAKKISDRLGYPG